MRGAVVGDSHSVYNWEPGRRSDAVTSEKFHLPTEHIPLQQLLRVLIEEMGVQPRWSDWNAILDGVSV